MADERACSSAPLTGLLLIAARLLAAQFKAAMLFAIVVAAIATLMFYEWTRLVRGWGATWYMAGFVYALLPALGLALDPRATPPLPSTSAA